MSFCKDLSGNRTAAKNQLLQSKGKVGTSARQQNRTPTSESGNYCRYDKIKLVRDDIHLPKDSPAYKPWRNQMKFLCMDRLYRDAKAEDYSFSVTFSATPETRNKIKSGYLELLKETQELVSNAESKETYQMSFDLFSWTERS